MRQKSIFRVVFDHELKTLLRNRVLTTLFALIVLILMAALWTGSSMVRKQRQTISKIDAYRAEITDSLTNRIRRIEASNMRYNGFIWDDPTFAYNTARNEGPPFAVKPPFALQALNVGQSDLQPFYYKVTITKNQDLTHESEIENSFLQLMGNFDFSFVVIYLFPLLIIVFAYNVLSVEKEQGTWVLLKTSNQSIARLIALRMGTRFGLFTVFFWLLVTPVLVFLLGGSFLSTPNWWWLVAFVSLYFAFWFALSFLVNSFSLNSTVNAMVLIFIWLFTGILVPNLLQIGLNRVYPIPSRIALVNAERNALNQYFEREGQLLTKDVFSNPRAMIRQASIVTPGMVYGYGVITYKSQEIKDRAAHIAEQQLVGQIQRQQEAIRRLQVISPALMLEEALSAFSGTHWYQFNQFRQDVDRFRQEVQQFFTGYMASQKTYRTFSVKDVATLPRFRPRPYHDYDWLYAEQAFAVYVVLVFTLILIGYRRMTWV